MIRLPDKCPFVENYRGSVDKEVQHYFETFNRVDRIARTIKEAIINLGLDRFVEFQVRSSALGDVIEVEYIDGRGQRMTKRMVVKDANS